MRDIKKLPTFATSKDKNDTNKIVLIFKTFKVMVKNQNLVINLQSVDNYKELSELVNNSISEIKSAKRNIMYYVNQLNKLQRKNEFIDGVNLHELGKKVRNYALLHGYEVPTNAPFNAYLFEKINGVSCYKKRRNVKASEKYAISETIIEYKNVVLSEVGLIRAYRYILGVDAKQADKSAREYNKAINKAQSKEQSAKRKELRKLQNDARKQFAAGNMTIEEFADIMKRCA